MKEHLSKQQREEANQYGGLDKDDWEDIKLPAYYDKPNHWERSASHQPSHSRHKPQGSRLMTILSK